HPAAQPRDGDWDDLVPARVERLHDGPSRAQGDLVLDRPAAVDHADPQAGVTVVGPSAGLLLPCPHEFPLRPRAQTGASDLATGAGGPAVLEARRAVRTPVSIRSACDGSRADRNTASGYSRLSLSSTSSEARSILLNTTRRGSSASPRLSRVSRVLLIWSCSEEEEESTTCTRRSAPAASSSVLRNEATRWCGSLRMKPTVSTTRND